MSRTSTRHQRHIYLQCSPRTGLTVLVCCINSSLLRLSLLIGMFLLNHVALTHDNHDQLLIPHLTIKIDLERLDTQTADYYFEDLDMIFNYTLQLPNDHHPGHSIENDANEEATALLIASLNVIPSTLNPALGLGLARWRLSSTLKP